MKRLIEKIRKIFGITYEIKVYNMPKSKYIVVLKEDINPLHLDIIMKKMQEFRKSKHKIMYITEDINIIPVKE